MVTRIVLVFLLASALTSRAQVLLSDDFESGGTLDPNRWVVGASVDGSSVGQSGGSAVFFQHGVLRSAQAMAQDIVVTGTVRIGTAGDELMVVVRAAAAGNTHWGDHAGIVFELSRWGGDTLGIFYLDESGGYYSLAQKSYALTTGASYQFTVTVQGSQLSFAINGTTELTATSSLSYGNYMTIANSDGAGATSYLDAISVAAVPEPATAAFAGGLCGLGVVAIRRWRRGGDSSCAAGPSGPRCGDERVA
ncbi:MAG: hypothetical protein KF715_07405 [Candidatus Didemnitutus sp.]|nr:hypothetical protein [Candidatus Didemnitutus sp.]